MFSDKNFINYLDKDCALAITCFEKGIYKVYYSPDGCMTKANLDSFEGFVFHPFQETLSTPALYLQPSTTFIAKDILSLERFFEHIKPKTNLANLNLENHIINKSEYITFLESVIDYVNEELPKVVISRIENKVSQINPLKLFDNFCSRYPKNGNYLFYSKESGLWIGSSPETLIEINHGKGKTCALAGTKPTNESWSSKEEYEQSVVEDYINDIFQKFDIKYISNKKTISLKGINHIKTDYSFNTNNQFSLQDFVNEIHPTPAVAGLPKQKAIDFITNNEKHTRSYYTGYFGSVSKYQTKLFVNLRCLKTDGINQHYYLGGGITNSSIPEKEYEETVRKMKSIID